jgi:hypothetical protein
MYFRYSYQQPFVSPLFRLVALTHKLYVEPSANINDLGAHILFVVTQITNKDF